MAVHIFRREATYYWRRRTRHALANFLGRPHVFMSLRTTSPVTANPNDEHRTIARLREIGLSHKKETKRTQADQERPVQA